MCIAIVRVFFISLAVDEPIIEAVHTMCKYTHAYAPLCARSNLKYTYTCINARKKKGGKRNTISRIYSRVCKQTNKEERKKEKEIV